MMNRLNLLPEEGIEIVEERKKILLNISESDLFAQVGLPEKEMISEDIFPDFIDKKKISIFKNIKCGFSNLKLVEIVVSINNKLIFNNINILDRDYDKTIKALEGLGYKCSDTGLGTIRIYDLGISLNLEKNKLEAVSISTEEYIAKTERSLSLYIPKDVKIENDIFKIYYDYKKS
ncbi:hypothetical protein Dip518_001575 [Parelusimicrobium proximum]|uniref:hypothetical protein n=1 Tax=Parelusimicrobium proximum TaxID=3228953 RepID=UPI003D16D7EF